MLKKYLEWIKKHKIITAVAAIVVLIALLSSGSSKEQGQPANWQTEVKAPAQSTQQSAASAPISAYEKIDTKTIQNYRAYIHYRFTGSKKPTIDEVKKLMVEIEKQGCGEPQVCNYFLWDSKEAYEASKDNLEGLANEVAEANNNHLVGYVNSGFAFYYYGSSGDGKGKLTILDPDSGTYTDF